METKLLPCPFCGGEAAIAKLSKHYFAKCLKCWSNTAYCETKTEAVEAWNRRRTMNDCIWYWVDACNADRCRNCKQYVSVNCDMGRQMHEAHQRDIEKAMESVREEWAKKMGACDAD